MKRKMILAGSLAALMAATVAQAEDGRLPVAQLDRVLERAKAVGFRHFGEIEVKGEDSVEIEGWLDDERQAEVRLSLETGEILEEERRRSEGDAWGLREAEVRQAVKAAQAEGLVDFEEVQVDRDGRIEVEGRDGQGREIEVGSRQGEATVSGAARD